MQNDPALLTYTKDFLEGTADLSVEEFGAYTRLIFHQHQRWSLPNNEKKLARLAGCSLPEFREIWKEIAPKFSLSEDRELYNERCRKEMANRANNARLKSILSVYANWLKYNKNLTKQQKQEVKNQFSTVQFLDIENDDERKDKIIKHLKKLSQAILKGSHYIGNGNEDGNEDVKEIEVNFGKSENLLEIQVLRTEIKNEFTWKETVCRNLREIIPKFTSDIFDDYLEIFFKQIENDGEESKSIQDTKKHFSRWLNIQLTKNDSIKNTDQELANYEARIAKSLANS